MASLRYLCSHLVTLTRADQAIVVNLEEIEAGGAVVESETELALGARVEVRCESVSFAGIVTNSDGHGFGCRITIEFSPLTPWSVGRFRPEHLFDPCGMFVLHDPE